MLMWWVDRETGIAGTVFQQILPPNDKPSEEFLAELEKAVYSHVRELK